MRCCAAVAQQPAPFPDPPRLPCPGAQRPMQLPAHASLLLRLNASRASGLVAACDTGHTCAMRTVGFPVRMLHVLWI